MITFWKTLKLQIFMTLFKIFRNMELKFKNNGKEAILIVNNEEFVVSEEIMSLAFNYFHEKIGWYFFWTIKDRYKAYINGEKYIKEYLLKYVPKKHTCPHCGAKNVDYYHIDRCVDLPF